MKLKSYEASLSEKMSEFDIWVTPSLGEIRDTPQFRENLDTLKHGFDLLSQLTDNFVDYSHCSSSVLSNNTIEYTKLKDEDTAIDILNSIWNVLLLATGKTDNNLKCQYPLLLRNTYEIFEYPQKNTRGQWRNKSLPRTLSLEDITKIIVNLLEKPDYLKIFTESYFHLIISDELYAKQLWSLGSAYISQKALGNEDSLISSMVIFQSRGFIQIRTAPIKLRRELQGIHFLTTLEIEHAILCTSGEKTAVISMLVDDGYSEEEITHALTRAIENQHVSISDADVLGLKPERVEMVRKYCLLDLVANYGRPIPDNETTGCLMVAGYKTLWGLPQAEVIQIALEKIPKLDFLWETKLAPFSDIQWLVDKGFIRSK